MARQSSSVTNTGRDMAGASAWREYEADVLTQSGTFQLVAGAAQVWTFASNGVPVEFQADQRPGHPGASAPRLTLTCSKPTALTLSSFSATSAGNRGACAEGNKVRGLPCTVTAFTPGYVSGTCDGGLTFSGRGHRGTFRLDQAVTAQGLHRRRERLDADKRAGNAAAHQQVGGRSCNC